MLNLGDRKRLLKAIAALPAAGLARDKAEAAGRPAPPVEARHAERRQLTVMFCDLVGSTELAARLDPEDLRDVMRAYHTECAEVVGRFEGHVAKFLGDGVLAYFGWPQAHEDDAERAVRAARALVEAIAQLDTHPPFVSRHASGSPPGRRWWATSLARGHRARRRWSARCRTWRAGSRRWPSPSAW